MRLNKSVLFVFMIIFLLSLNFIVAKDINETNLNADSFEIDYDDSISSSYDTNLQKLNQNDIEKTDESLEKSDNSSNRLLNEDNNNGLLGDGDGLKHLYVAPNATGSGLDENDPGDFITILNNTEDNTVIHMLEGTYLLSNITPIYQDGYYHFISIKSKNNISIVGENPDKVKIISNLTPKKRTSFIFSLHNTNNFKFENITFSAIKKDPKKEKTKSYFLLNKNNYIFENCKFIDAYSKFAIIELDEGTHLTINNCYFTSTDGHVGREISPRLFCSVLLNNTIFKNCCRYSDYKIGVMGNYSIFNSQFLEYDDNPLLYFQPYCNLIFENNYVDHPYNFVFFQPSDHYEGSNRMFCSHTTLTFLNGEDSVNVNCGDVINLNASLVDDLGNILSLYKLKFNLFENDLTYTNGVYQKEVTVPDVPGEYYIDVSDEMFTKYLGNCTVKAPIFIVKEAPEFLFDDKNSSTYGEDVIINVDSLDIPDGKLTFRFNNSEIIKNITDYRCSINLGVLPAGEYAITAYYAGDEVYGAKSYTKTFNVTKAKSTISLTKGHVDAIKDNGDVGFYFSTTENGNENTIGIILPDNATGKLTFKLDTDTYSIDITKRKVLLGNLDYGSYIIAVKYDGDNNFNESEECTFTLVNSKPSVDLTLNYSNINYTNPFNVNVTLNQDVVKDTIIFEVRDLEDNLINSTTGIISNKSANATFTGLNAGEYNIIAIYEGDETYCNSIASQRFNVNKIDLEYFTLKADKTISIHDNIKVEALIPVNVGGSITFRINGQDMTVEIFNNRAEAIFDNPGLGNYTVYATFNGDDNYNPHEENINITVIKADANLSVSAENVDWGEELVVVVKTDTRFTGNLSVKIDGVEKIVEITEGQGNVSFSNLKAGKYNVAVEFNESEFFTSSQKDINVTVNKIDSALTLDNDEMVFDYGGSASVTFGYDGAVNVTAEVVNHPEAVIKINEDCIVVSDLDAGQYTLKVTTVPDENHTGVDKEFEVTVNKIDSALTLDNDEMVFDYGGSASVTFDYDGAVNVTAEVVNHPEAVIKINEDCIVVSDLDAGQYTLKVTTVPDENHNSVDKTISITVNKVNANINIEDIVLDYGSHDITVFTGEGIESVNANILNQSYANVIVSGNNISIYNLNVGEYVLQLIVNPDENHNSVSKNVKVTVNKIDSVIDIRNEVVFTYGDAGYCDVYSEGAVDFTVKVINHPEAVININKNGIVKVSALNAGTYIMEVTTNPDTNHNSVTGRVNVTVNKADSKIIIPDIIFDYGNSGSVNILVYNATGIGNVNVVGHPEAITTINGTKISVGGLNAGSYILTATALTGDNYNPVNVSANVIVNKLTTIIGVKKVNGVYGSSGKLIVTLKDSNGNLLTGKLLRVKVGSISKTLTTNRHGQVSVNVAYLIPKSYNAKISFAGDNDLVESSNTAKVVIKKATPKLTAKTLKTKVKTKNKKLKITLKNKKGKALKNTKVTLKLKGKTYKAKTNKKGIATFKITKLNKRGTFKGTVKFAGNKYFKAINKKVKVIVKK
ncbi:hypothetical protein EDC42_1565 [Methanobrevibacter gottschalkii DSM 11977]|uniref:Adhesin-like protein n=3 Tax=Methanobrevibacter TaxID=2172 RepID=A0A3N5B025_9EURY|nr:Ig-like domain-containing protein [Methanobrevibacter gottschalkii]RPF50906.1 hypothetical protein EDC42_1565 [Methanobrevibacter gottschalkii DSM 11977]